MENGSYRVKLSGGRRVVLPPNACKELGIKIGDSIVVRIENGRVSLHSAGKLIERFREKLRGQIGDDRSLVDELIAEREAEASRE